MRKFLYEMLETASVSGNEINLQKVVIKYMKSVSDKIITDHAGDVICVINPEANFKVLLAAHSDEIGLTIVEILNDGRALLKEVGSIKAGVYPGQKVRVITDKGEVFGVVGFDQFTFKSEITDKNLILDIGVYSKDEAEKIITIGDSVILDSNYRELNDNIISARALDDKIGVYSIMEVLKKSKNINKEIGVYCASTVGEETTKAGATFVSNLVKPDCAIIIDVTHDSSIMSNKGNREFTMNGKGPVLSIGTVINKEFVKKAQKAAKNKNVSLQVSTEVYRTYTDLDKIYFNESGIPSLLISIPLRYMHSSAELVDMNDVNDIISLITEIIELLKTDRNFNPFELL